MEPVVPILVLQGKRPSRSPSRGEYPSVTKVDPMVL